ncbi:MAG: hypothetical protein ACPGQS_08020 [Bradymonadia bacterium]
MKKTAQFAQFVMLPLLLAYGCASGRAMTDQEQVEYSQLENEIETQKIHNAERRQTLKKAFLKSKIKLSTNARLCNVKKSTHSTKPVPLVYGAKKRVVFIAVKENAKCKAARIEVTK